MATYGSAEWAQQQYGSNPYKPPTPVQPTSQPSYYLQYIEQMKAQQAAQMAAAKAAELQQKQNSLWYQLTQVPARDSKAGSMIWGGAMNAAANINRGYQNMVQRQSSSNQAYAQRYNGMSFSPSGDMLAQTPYDTIQTGSWNGKDYTYGQAMQKWEYDRLQDENNKRLLGILTNDIVENQSYAPKRKPTEDELNILREQRRGYQVGMPGIDFVQNPQVLGSPSTNNNGGYGGYGGYPDFSMPYMGYGGYGGYGGGGYSYPKYSQSQDASKWYQTMVQWNIGNKQA